jgi:hypothetical protein
MGGGGKKSEISDEVDHQLRSTYQKAVAVIEKYFLNYSEYGKVNDNRIPDVVKEKQGKEPMTSDTMAENS